MLGTIERSGGSMSDEGRTEAKPRTAEAPKGLRRIEHYALYLINGMASGGSAGLSDGDIDYAIDVAERLAHKLAERGHIQPHE
jgi:hypothetical protein